MWKAMDEEMIKVTESKTNQCKPRESYIHCEICVAEETLKIVQMYCAYAASVEGFIPDSDHIFECAVKIVLFRDVGFKRWLKERENKQCQATV
jgi:hypothetical protein